MALRAACSGIEIQDHTHTSVGKCLSQHAPRGAGSSVQRGLPYPSELGTSEAPPRRGPIPSLGTNVLRDPLHRLPGPGLGGNSSRVREGCLRGVSLWFLLHRILAGGRTLRVSICHLVEPIHTRPAWDPTSKIDYSRGAMPEVIIPVLAANSKYKRTLEQKKDSKQKKEKRGTEAKTFSGRKTGVPAPLRLRRLAGTRRGDMLPSPATSFTGGASSGSWCGGGERGGALL